MYGTTTQVHTGILVECTERNIKLQLQLFEVGLFPGECLVMI